MGTRHLFIFALAASTVSAQASFEMTLLLNLGSNAVQRVDPENRMMLGSFGSNRLFNPSAITIDQANNEAYVLNAYASNPTTSRITVFNYNTGEFKREWNTGLNLSSVGDIDYIPGRGLYVPINTGIRLYSEGGATLTSYAHPTLANIYVVEASQSFDEVYGYGLTGSYGRWNQTTGAFLQSHTGIASHRGYEARPDQEFALGGAGQNIILHSFASLSTNAVSTGTIVNSVNAISYGHGDTVYAGCFGVSGQSVILTYDTNRNRLADPWTLPSGNGIVSMATVVAPEPGTLIASAVGIAALLRKRRNPKK